MAPARTRIKTEASSIRPSQIEGRVVKKRGTLLESLANKKGTPGIKVERGVKVKAEPVTTVPRSGDDGGEGPFPGFSRPYEEECRSVTRRLIELHGDPQKGWRSGEGDDADAEARHLIHGEDRLQVEVERVSVLDSLVGTILSQNTTDKTSHKAYASLKSAFPTWESVRTGDPSKVAESIKVGGLSEIKTGRIQSILSAVHKERGECSLEHLRSMSDEYIKRYLSAFKGVGPKTVSCVLMFCLQRPDFPVDVHVWKLAVALGWVPAKASREQTYEHLNRKVPSDVKYDLHVLLVEHGKVFNNDAKHLRPCVKEALRRIN